MAMPGEPRCIVITAPVLGENWANINDPVERRRAQNRIAQRGYRRRLRKGGESTAQNIENSSRAKVAVEPAAGMPLLPPDSKLAQPQTSQPAAAIAAPHSSRERPLQPYPHPHPHQKQQTSPQLPSDLHPYTTQLDHIALAKRPWDQTLEQEPHQGIFHLETPVSDQTYVAPHKLPSQPFHSSTETSLLLSTPRVTPESNTSAPRGADAAHGHTALHRAALHGHESVLAVLLKAGADPTLPDSTGLTPLHLAAQQGHVRAVHLLLASGSQSQDIVSQATQTGETALHLAVQAQQPMVIRTLLEHSARAVNDQDWWGRTALHMACELNQQELVEILVHAGAQLDIRDFEGQTLLHRACLGASSL